MQLTLAYTGLVESCVEAVRDPAVVAPARAVVATAPAAGGGHALTTVKLFVPGRRGVRKTDWSSYDSSDPVSKPLARLQAYSHNRQPMHSERSTSTPFTLGESAGPWP